MNSPDMNLVQLVLHASWIVKAVLALLLVISVTSWAVIAAKMGALRRTRGLNTLFEQHFWSGASLNELYDAASRNARSAGPTERIFASGMREFLKLRERQAGDPLQLVDGARRAMRASFQRETDMAESKLSFLASVGSISPYVGLFGTVWGIMHAFTGLAGMEQVSLATVAPGIAESLVTTAVGLFAAIPAVVAYNFFARDIERITVAEESFIDEFSNILQRNAASRPAVQVPPASADTTAFAATR
ncbi:MAG: protein TolQ [Brachymonas sp.]